MTTEPTRIEEADSETREVAVCVVGAGPVGASLACRLAAAGLEVAVVDRAPLPPMEHPEFDGRAYAIAATSRAFLAEAGVWQHLPLPPCPIEGIRVSDGRPGQAASPLFLQFDHHAIGQPFGWMTEARSLRVALNAALHASPRIEVLAPDAASVRFDTGGGAGDTRSGGGRNGRGAGGGDGPADIVLASGRRLRARLVVAAEGRDSALRSQAGIAATRFTYRQTAIVCAIVHERPHHNQALEHFLPGGPFAQLPMAPSEVGEHVSALVWSERSGLAGRLAGLPAPAFERELRRRLGSHLGEIRTVGRRWSYPLSALHAQSYVAPRLALVGDAAHGIHPIAGQGLNLGFRDIMALAELVMEAHARGADVGAPDLLARYQRRRRPDNLAMLAATDLLDRLFSTDNRALRLVRDVGIAAVHRMPGLKRGFMMQAMGLS